MDKRNLVLRSLAISTALAITQLGVTNSRSEERRAGKDSYLDIDNFIEERRRLFSLPGIALAIVEGDQIVHLRGFGHARPGGEAPTPQTPFFIGSITKSITALAIMQLVENCSVELEKPVVQYLPWFHTENSRESNQITIRHLLNHTSGLSALQGQEILADMTGSQNATELQVRGLSSVKLANPPGNKFDYNNTNYNILGLIIETASGESYTEYIQTHIFNPLKMHHSYFTKSAAQQNGLAMGHRYWFGHPIPTPNLTIPQASLPSGQLISCAEDFSHFLIAQLNGGWYGDAQILSSAGIAEMHRGNATMIAMGMTLGSYAMGWETHKKGATTIISHSGIVPDYGGYASLIPEQKKGLVFLYNANHAMMKLTFDEFGTQVTDRLIGEHSSTTVLLRAPWLMRSMALIPLFQVAGVVSTIKQSKHREQNPENRPHQGILWGRHILLPLLPNLLAALMLLPLLSKMRGWLQLFMPDFSWIARISGSFGLIWAIMRTGIVIHDAHKKRY
jgi:CubicO group peptidase (beta-lactamase class C family)